MPKKFSIRKMNREQLVLTAAVINLVYGTDDKLTFEQAENHYRNSGLKFPANMFLAISNRWWSIVDEKRKIKNP